MAEAIANRFTVWHQRSDRKLYGERVAFGASVQLFLEGRPMAEINAPIDFCHPIRLPTSLHDLNLGDVRPEELRHVAEVVCAATTSDGRSLFRITPEVVLDAIITADAYSQYYASAWKQRSDYAPSRSSSQSVSAY